MKFDEFLSESKAADEAKQKGWVSAGYGLWKDKQGKVVARTVNDKLEPVKGARADVNNYHSNVPSKKTVDYDSIDSVNSAIEKYLTPGSKTDTEVTKYSTYKTSGIHAEKAKHLHDDLVAAGFTYEKDDFDSHVYRKGNTSVTISDKPEVSHKPGAKNDHHSIVVAVDHIKDKK